MERLHPTQCSTSHFRNHEFFAHFEGADQWKLGELGWLDVGYRVDCGAMTRRVEDQGPMDVERLLWCAI